MLEPELESTQRSNEFPIPEASEYTIGYTGVSRDDSRRNRPVQKKPKLSKVNKSQLHRKEARQKRLNELFRNMQFAQSQTLFLRSAFPVASSIISNNINKESSYETTLSTTGLFGKKIIPKLSYTAEGILFRRKKKRKPSEAVEQPGLVKQPSNVSIRSFGSWHVGPEYHHMNPAVKHTEIKIFWTTTEISKCYPRGQQAIEMSIVELIMNLFFLVLILLVAFNFKPTERFHYYNHLVHVITKTENPNYMKPGEVQFFCDIRSIDHIFSYLNYTFVYGQWLNFFYARQKDKVAMTGMGPIFNFLGVPRVRQLRTPANICDIAPQFEDYIEDCYSNLDKEWQYVDPIIPVKDLFRRRDNTIFLQFNPDHWVWKPPVMDYEYEIATDMSRTYPGGGYEFIINHGDRADNLNSLKLNYMHAMGWIRRQSRLIVVEFTLYNSNINLITSVKLLFEILPSGGVWPTYQIHNVKIFHLHSKWDHFIFGCIAAQSAFVLLFITEEMREIHFFGISYFVRFWSWVDLAVITLVILQQYSLFLVLTQSQSFITYFTLNRDKYFQMDDLIYHDGLHDTFLMCNVFLSLYKLFRYVDYYGKVDRFTRTLRMASPALWTFIIRFAIIYAAYVQLGFFLFGSYNVEFASRARGVLTLLRMYYGYYNYAGLTRLQPYFGAAFFLGGVIVLFAMCLGFFLVVFYNFYLVNEMVTTVTRGPSAFGMLICLCKKFYYLRLRSERKKKISDQDLPISNITYKELVEAMEIMNFTKPEMDILTKKYKLLNFNTANSCEVFERLIILQDEINRNIMKMVYPKSRMEPEPKDRYPMITYQDYTRLNLLIESIEILSSILDERTVRAVLFIKRRRRDATASRLNKQRYADMSAQEYQAYLEEVCAYEREKRKLQLEMEGFTEHEITAQIKREEAEAAEMKAKDQTFKKNRRGRNPVKKKQSSDSRT